MRVFVVLLLAVLVCATTGDVSRPMDASDDKVNGAAWKPASPELRVDLEAGEPAGSKKRLSVLLASGMFPAHVFPLVALGQELLARGHRVALLSLEYKGSKVIPDLPKSAGIEFISAGDGHWSMDDYEGLTKKAKGQNFINTMRVAMNVSCEGARNMFNAIESLDLDAWDFLVFDNVVIMEFYHLFKKLGRTRMMLNYSPLPVMPSMQPSWPFPVVTSSCSEQMTFMERLVTALFYKPMEFLGMLMANIAITHICSDVGYDIDVEISFDDVGFLYPVLLNSVIGFEFSKPSYPMQHYVGPMLMRSPPPLQESLRDWLDRREPGSVVYVTMGTSCSLTMELARAFVRGIAAANYSAVWVLRESNRDILEGLSVDADRIRLEGWVSQLAVLSHPSIGVTLNHGGLGCVQEALYCGLPMVVIPFAFDQYEVASRVHYQGLGVRLFEHEVTEASIASALTTAMTTGGGYRERAGKVSKLFKFAGGARRAADLVEHYTDVGYEHAIPAFTKYRWSWVKYYNLDVYVTIATVGYLAQRLLRRVCCCWCSKCRRRSAKDKKD